MILPSWTTTIGCPSSTGRNQGIRKFRYEVATCSEREGPDGDHRAGHRIVALREPLLEGVADDDQQDEVERLEGRQLPPSHQPHEQEDEDVQDDCADRDIHAGKDRHVTLGGEQERLAVEEARLLRARAEGRGVDLHLQVEGVGLALTDVAEVEGQQAVLARFAECGRLHGVQRDPLEPLGREDDDGVLDLLAREDAQPRLEDEPAAERVGERIVSVAAGATVSEVVARWPNTFRSAAIRNAKMKAP